MNLRAMENAEEIYHLLEDFKDRKPKPIPQELNDYLSYVARTGDPVYQWNIVKSLFKEKLMTVITDFYETSPGIDIPHYPNVDPFNYDIMRNSLLERLDAFSSAPFTVQRICELLTCPRKQYNRIDKYMRAIEKNILVVSTREPGIQRQPEPENGEPIEPIVNGSDNNSDYNVDVEMDDMSWKENSESTQSAEPQPSSSAPHTSVENVESRLQAEDEAPMEIHEKIASEYDSVTPPEENIANDEQMTEKPLSDPLKVTESPSENLSTNENLSTDTSTINSETEQDNVKAAVTLNVPEIKIDDTEMTEQRLLEEKAREDQDIEIKQGQADTVSEENQQMPSIEEPLPTSSDESSSNSSIKDETESKPVAEVLTSSEESSSSSDNTESNSNSPKHEIEIKNPVLVPEPLESVLTPVEQIPDTLNKEVEKDVETIRESTPPLETVAEESAKLESSSIQNIDTLEITEKSEKELAVESTTSESEPTRSNESDLASGDSEANNEISENIPDQEKQSEAPEVNTVEIQSKEISEDKANMDN